MRKHLETGWCATALASCAPRVANSPPRASTTGHSESPLQGLADFAIRPAYRIIKNKTLLTIESPRRMASAAMTFDRLLM